MINFTLLCPTRGRIKEINRLFQSIVDTAERLDEIEVALAVDDDDVESQNISHDRIRIVKTILPHGSTMGALDQACFDISSGRYVAGMNDDVVLRTKHWDTIFKDVFAMFPDDIGMLYINDMIFQEKLCTFPVLSRLACLEIGLCPKEYRRYRIDDHIFDIYNMLALLGHKRIVYLPEVIFEHHNYITDKNKPPEEVFVSKTDRVYAPDVEIINLDARTFEEKQIERKRAAIALAQLIDRSSFQRLQKRQQTATTYLHHSTRNFPYRLLLANITNPYSYRRPDFIKKLPNDQVGAQVAHRVTVAVVSADIQSDFASQCVSLIKDHTTNYDLMILDNNKGHGFNHPHEMNRILQVVDTDYLVLMDDDVLVEEGWLTGLMKCMDEKTAVVMPVHKDKDGELDYTGGYIAGDGRGTHRHLTDMPTSPREVQGVCSAIMLIDLRKVNYIMMDERYAKYFFDLIYGFEVWEAGYKVMITPEVVVSHLGGATMIRGTQEASGLWSRDEVIFMNEWVNSDRLRKLGETWRSYPSLRPLVEIPERIHRLFGQGDLMTDEAFEKELNSLIQVAQPYELFSKMIANASMQYAKTYEEKGQAEKAKLCQTTYVALNQKKSDEAQQVDISTTNLVQTATSSASKPSTDKAAILVSAIVSTYNSERFMRTCLEDLEAQTLRDRMEIIVIDSGSLQKEGEIVKEFQKKFQNIRYTRTKRENSHVAFNHGIEMAQGKYLTIANTDDRHHPDAYRRMVEVLESRADIGLVYFDSAVTQTPNTTLDKGPIIGRFRWPEFDRRLLFQVCYMGPQPMWRRSLHNEHGMLDPEFTSAGDYEFWLRISDKTGFYHIPQVLGLYYESSSSNEHKDPSVSIREAEQARVRYWKTENGPRPPAAGNFLERYNITVPREHAEKYPLVSVVIPTHDRPAELKTALDSVIAQTYPNYEVIVVNDAGEDVSHIVKRFESKCKIRYESHSENRGAGSARNTGMRLAQGKYVAFLDDDDTYYPMHLFALVAELENDPTIVAAYTDGIRITRDATNAKHKIIEKKVGVSLDFSLPELLVRNYIPNLCLVFRREALERAGYFEENMQALEDWEWLIRLGKVGPFTHLAFVTNEYLVWKGKKTRNILPPEMIQKLYQQIYAKFNNLANTPVLQAQVNCYKAMTGRNLWEDAPQLFDTEAKFSKKTLDTFSLLINSGDVLTVLRQHEADLDEELLSLVRLNADTARSDGKKDRAQGLDNLAAYIGNALAERNKGAASIDAAATLKMLLDANDLVAALKANEDKLDASLLKLVRANASSARNEGQIDLANGLDDLAGYVEKVNESRSKPASAENAAAVLQTLLDSDDLLAALKEHEDKLDAELLELVRKNASSSRGEGQTALADGLDNLAAYIENILPSRK